MVFDDRSRLWKWLRLALLLSALCTLIGLYRFSTFYAQYRLEGRSDPVREILVNEMTAAYSFLLLLPLLILFLIRVPLRRDNWFWTVPVYLLVSVAFGAVYTTLMTLTRTWVFPLANLGRYDPGPRFYRYLMEYHVQFMIFAFVAAVVHAVGRLRASQERERESAELALRASNLQAQLSEARLRALQGQLQPHFLFNTLNMISSLMYEDVGKADRMMTRLSTLLRMSLDTSERPSVPLRQEMDILGVYLEIMEARFGQRLRVARHMDAETAEVPVPALLLQPLVENAIRHGALEPDQTLEVSVRAVPEGGHLRLEVSDNGPGLTRNEAASDGLGLRSIRDRLAELYGDRARLRLENLAPRGLLVTVELPLAAAGREPLARGAASTAGSRGAEASQ
jgi:two-component system, LytTR family, sensor kinase